MNIYSRLYISLIFEEILKMKSNTFGMILDIEKFIKENGIDVDEVTVTNPSFQIPGSGTFTEDGIFSETIFGEVGDNSRMTSFGIIKLHTTILHPDVFRILNNLICGYRAKHTLMDVVAETCCIVVHEGVKTEIIPIEDYNNNKDMYIGSTVIKNIKQLQKHWNQLYFKVKHKDIDKRSQVSFLFKSDKEVLKSFFIDKVLVLPAGERDIKLSGDDLYKGKDKVLSSSIPEVNELYINLIKKTNLMEFNKNNDAENPLLVADIQKAVDTVCEFIAATLPTKYGRIATYNMRKTTNFAGRFTILPSTMTGDSPEDSPLDIDACGYPIHAILAMFEPECMHAFRIKINDLFEDEVVSKDILDYYDTKQMLKFFKRIVKDKRFLISKLEFDSQSGKKYEFELEFIKLLFDRDTMVLDFIIPILFDICEHNYVMVTRYPLESEKGVQFTRPYLETTDRTVPYNQVCEKLVDAYMNIDLDNEEDRDIDRSDIESMVKGVLAKQLGMTGRKTNYPIAHPDYEKNQWIDSIRLPPGMLAEMGADFDGDQVNANGIKTDEAKEEISRYLKTVGNHVGGDGSNTRGFSKNYRVAMEFLTTAS